MAQDLPILEHRKKILRHIRDHRVTCIHGETGCGKSTMVPQFILDHHERMKSRVRRSRQAVSQEDDVKIIVTQPRRMAAISLAKRVANQYKEEVGNTIGYRIGGDSQVSDGTRIFYVTTGLLLQVTGGMFEPMFIITRKMLTNNPESFNKYTHIILDEIHERQIDSDLLSLIVRMLAGDPDYPNNKIIIMSATLEGELFSQYFSELLNADSEGSDNAGNKVIFVGAKRFEVAEVYLDDLIEDDTYKNPLGADGIMAATLAYVKFNRQKPVNQAWDFKKYVKDLMLQNFASCVENGAASYPEAKQDLDLLEKGLAAKFPMKPEIFDGLNYVCIQLIKHFMRPGETILVFLPGVGEIRTIHDTLASLERYGQGCKCLFRLFTLNSRILKEQQIKIADTKPPDDHAHIILSTNIAESSLTLPKVRYVIDFGLRRHMVYVPQRSMECLVKTWVSQASAEQRKGRTGREFEGTVIRLYTRFFFEYCMLKFDKPEMQVAALDKLVLQAKLVGRKVAGGMGPSALLSQAISPPDIENVRDAVVVLANAGALTDANEEADMTLMALLVLHLPLDLTLCRLIFFGTIFGCVADVIVMAAGLSLTQCVLSLPTQMVIKDPKTFRESLKWSFTTRSNFDGGEYSEPIMLVEMFKTWITYRLSSIRQKAKEDSAKISRQRAYIQDPVDNAWFRYSRKYAVNKQRFGEMENQVVGIAARMSKLLPADSDAAKKLKALVESVRTTKVSQPSKNMPVEARMSKLKMEPEQCCEPINTNNDTWMFSENKYLLKVNLAASFMPRFLCGTSDGTVDTKKGAQNKGKRQILEEAGFAVDRSAILNNTPACVSHDANLCKTVVDIMFTPHEVTKYKTKGDGRLFLEFSDWPDQSRHVVQDISWRAHSAFQFGEGRDKSPCPGLPYNLQRQGPSMFGRATHPSQICWKYLERSIGNATQIVQGTPKGWRNPVGFACERRNIIHYAVAAEVQGCEDTNKCLVDGVTILPPESDGLLTMAAILTFLPGRYPLSIVIEEDSTQTDRIKAIIVMQHKMAISPRNPLRPDLICRMNSVRKEVSVLLNRGLDEATLPNVDLQPLIERMITYVLNKEQQKGLPHDVAKKGKSEPVKETVVEIFHPSLSHALSHDSLDSTDSESLMSDNDGACEELPESFNYLQVYKVEEWFPHSLSEENQKLLLKEKDEVKQILPPDGACFDPEVEDPVVEDPWD